MIGRRSAIGIAVLCALAVSAFAAASASAVGTTAYTCAKAPTGEQFSDAHCLTPHTGGTTGYKHVEITTPTEVSGTNARTATNTTASSPAILHGNISGVETAVECTKVEGMGKLANKEEGEMFAHIGEGVLEYTGCTVTKPVGKGCVVTGGAITTGKVTGRTLTAASKQAEIKAEGATFASIPISGCSVAALNNTFSVTGSLKVSINGATISSTSAGVTAEGLLIFGGQKAGLQGALTIGMTTPVADGEAITVT